MTTIVSMKCNGHLLLAADKRTVEGNVILPTNASKIVQVNKNVIVSGCGDVGALQQMLNIAIKDIYSSAIESPGFSNDTDLSYSPTELTMAMAKINFFLPLEYKRFSPFEFIVCGFWNGIAKGYSVDCSGSVIEIDSYWASGSGSTLAYGQLADHYDPNDKYESSAEKMHRVIEIVSKHEVNTDDRIDAYAVFKDRIEKVNFKIEDEVPAQQPEVGK